jgi:hypothetical protein
MPTSFGGLAAPAVLQPAISAMAPADSASPPLAVNRRRRSSAMQSVLVKRISYGWVRPGGTIDVAPITNPHTARPPRLDARWHRSHVVLKAADKTVRRRFSER